MQGKEGYRLLPYRTDVNKVPAPGGVIHVDKSQNKPLAASIVTKDGHAMQSTAGAACLTHRSPLLRA
jgi:hypothetical protein